MRQGPNKKLIAAVLGAGLILALVLTATTSGLGGLSLPEGDVAFVEEVGDGDITREDFDIAIEQAAARQGIQEAPAAGTPQYDLLVDSAMADLLLAKWVAGEAADLGIEVSEREILAERDSIIEEQFGGQKQFDRFLEQQGFSEEDALERVELQLLSARIQEEVIPAEPEIADEVIQAFYDDNIEQFETPETRDVRTILNPDEAEAQTAFDALSKDDSDQSWDKVAKKFSTDEATAELGGLRQGVVQGQNEAALDEAIFSASEGELAGPIETDAGFYVLGVDTITPASTQELDDQVREQISQTLVTQAQQTIASDFQESFVAKWRQRTICAEDVAIERCSNSVPDDGCVGDDPGDEVVPDPETGEDPPLACPAPVTSIAPLPPFASATPAAPDPSGLALQAPTAPWDAASAAASGALVPGRPQGPALGGTPAPAADQLGVPGATQIPGAPPAAGGAAPPGTAPPGAAPAP